MEELKKQILKTIRNRRSDVFRIVRKFANINSQTAESELLEKTLLLLSSDKDFIREFSFLMKRENQFKNFDDNGTASMISEIGSAAGTLLNGFYGHRIKMKEKDFSGQLNLLSEKNKSENTRTYVIAGAGILAVLIISIVLIVKK